MQYNNPTSLSPHRNQHLPAFPGARKLLRPRQREVAAASDVFGVQQLFERAAHVGARPIEAAHPMSDDPAMAVDDESLRHTAYVVSLAYRVVRVQQHPEMIAVLVDPGFDYRPAIAVLAHRQHHEVLIRLELVA